jgi:hypothetical protein
LSDARNALYRLYRENKGVEGGGIKGGIPLRNALREYIENDDLRTYRVSISRSEVI